MKKAIICGAATVVTTLAAALLKAFLPDVRRYLHIRRM
ncbi:DUF6893 family small protein [Streptomyces toxytricini]